MQWCIGSLFLDVCLVIFCRSWCRRPSGRDWKCEVLSKKSIILTQKAVFVRFFSRKCDWDVKKCLSLRLLFPQKGQQTLGELLNRSWITTLMLEWAKCQNPLSVGVPDSMAQQFPVRFCAMWWGRGRVVEICTFLYLWKFARVSYQ